MAIGGDGTLFLLTYGEKWGVYGPSVDVYGFDLSKVIHCQPSYLEALQMDAKLLIEWSLF